MSSEKAHRDVPGARDLAATLRDQLTPLVAAAGFDLEEVKITPAGRRSVVRVVVDSDTGVDLDAIASVSRVVSDALDTDEMTELIPGAYQLEVTSPGVDRPLREPRHWQRAVGRRVTVEIAGKTRTGRVLSADTTGIVFSVDGVEQVLAWNVLGLGKVQVEFNRESESDSTAQAQTGEG